MPANRSVILQPTIAVFDIGNILLRWDPRNLYARIFGSRREMEHFLATVLPPEWNLEQDRGRGWPEAEAEAIARHPEYAAAIRAFRARWPEMLAGAIPENVALLADLRAAGVETYAITNFATDTFAEAQEMFPFLKGFKGIICSGQERLLKPDPAIFRLFLDRYGLAAEQCAFIDDSAQNTASAAALGFHAIHFGLGIDARRAFAQLGFPV